MGKKLSISFLPPMFSQKICQPFLREQLIFHISLQSLHTSKSANAFAAEQHQRQKQFCESVCLVAGSRPEKGTFRVYPVNCSLNQANIMGGNTFHCISQYGFSRDIWNYFQVSRNDR